MTVQFGQTCYVLAVHDVAASQAYYIDKLGFEALDIDAPGWLFVQRGTARFDMGECIGTPEAHTLGDHSWVARIFVEGLDEYHEEIAAKGALVTSCPTTKPWGLREMGVMTPDGHRFVFCSVVD